MPAHQGLKSRSCGLVQRIGTVDSATPQPDPSGGQAPRLAKSSTALHFLIPPSTIGLQFGTFRRWRAGIEVDWRAHPGSESRTCFHSDRSCRLAPARQGMKNRICGLVQRIGTADSATPHPDPSGGQAPALHFPLRPCDYLSLPLPSIGQTTSTLPSRTPNISSWSITVVSL